MPPLSLFPTPLVPQAAALVQWFTNRSVRQRVKMSVVHSASFVRCRYERFHQIIAAGRVILAEPAKRPGYRG